MMTSSADNSTFGRIFSALEARSSAGSIGAYVSWGMMALIALNVVSVVLETVDGLYRMYAGFFRWFEVLSVSIFTIEYVLRIATCTSDPDYREPFRGRLSYALSFLAVVDLLAILPFYLPFILPVDLRFLRVLRLMRLLKFGRYSHSLQSLGGVLQQKKQELLVSGFVVLLLLIVASSLMYFVEHEAQPEAFANIPATMWWGIATLTTVGYGDIYPITALGKVIGAIISILGIGMFALPAGILASGFAEAMKKQENRQCPHCGGELPPD